MATKLARKCSLISSEVGNHKIVNMHSLGMFMNYPETKRDKKAKYHFFKTYLI